LTLREETKVRLKDYRWPGNVRELRNIIDRGAAMSDLYFRLPDDFDRANDSDLGRAMNDLSGDHFATTADEKAEDPLPGRDGDDRVGFSLRPLWEGRSYYEAKEAVLADFERGYICSLLEAHRGNVSAAARAAGIHRNVLHRMMTRYGIRR
jgi:transcriptional regulator of acetoin/glycerol metabolism